MYFGIIEINDSGEVVTKTGSVSRRGVNLDADDILRDASSLEIVYLVSAAPRTVVHDIKLPAPLTGRSLESALRFEFENLLPLPLGQLYCGYRRLSRDNTRFRLFAVHRDAVRPLLEQVAASHLSCDAFVPAQLLDDQPGAAHLTPLQMLINYLPTDPAGKQLSLAPDLIPPDLKPVRYRQWRLLYRLMLGLLAATALALAVGRYQRYSEDFNTVYEARRDLDSRLGAARRESVRLAAENELYRKLTDAKIGTAAILPLLAALTERLPDYMWLASYSQSAGEIELSVISSQDDSNLQRQLTAGDPPYSYTNLSKAIRPDDGSVAFTIKLKSALP